MKTIAVLAALSWIAISFASLGVLAKYKTVPGTQGDQVADWPAGSAIRRDLVKPTLVLFLHPRCPCSRATVEELIAILSRSGDRPAVRVAFYFPSGEGAAWGDTDISRKVTGLPGVTTSRDEDGREAMKFGAATSGHLIAFDPRGRLRFSGGITGARGHRGDNPGRRAVIEFLSTGAPAVAAAPVFGCPILEDNEVKP